MACCSDFFPHHFPNHPIGTTALVTAAWQYLRLWWTTVHSSQKVLESHWWEKQKSGTLWKRTFLPPLRVQITATTSQALFCAYLSYTMSSWPIAEIEFNSVNNSLALASINCIAIIPCTPEWSPFINFHRSLHHIQSYCTQMGPNGKKD